MSYTSPLKDTKFVLENLLPAHEDLDDATIDAVGSVIKAIDGVENRKFKNAFCAVRPPGHHAEKDKAMGFCIYNNCAVAAHYLIDKFNYNFINPPIENNSSNHDILNYKSFNLSSSFSGVSAGT